MYGIFLLHVYLYFIIYLECAIYLYGKGDLIYMFEISKYKKSNVKVTIRLPENVNDLLKKIAKKEDMSFNNVLVSCIQNSLDELDLSKYKDVSIDD